MRVRIVIDEKGMTELGRDPGVVAEMRKQALILARKANATLHRRQQYADYDTHVDSGAGGKKASAAVFTRSNHAKYSNAKHQTLAKLL